MTPIEILNVTHNGQKFALKLADDFANIVTEAIKTRKPVAGIKAKKGGFRVEVVVDLTTDFAPAKIIFFGKWAVEVKTREEFINVIVDFYVASLI